MRRFSLQERALEIYRESRNLTLDTAINLAAEEHARLYPELPVPTHSRLIEPRKPQGRQCGADRNG